MGKDLLATVAVLEREAIDHIKNKLNADAYREAREVLLSEGIPEQTAARLAARITLRVKRAMQEI